MKKFIIASCTVILLLFVGFWLRYRVGFFIDLNPELPVTASVTTKDKTIYMEKDGIYVPFEIRGVDLGSGYPGAWSVDYKIDESTYMRWFSMIQELGANCIRIYTIHHDQFYNAFYRYNREREKNGEEPLYLIQGVWVNDYVYNSHNSGFSDDFLVTLQKDCRTAVDILHGNMPLSLGVDNVGNGSYRHDVSRWVLGYILGVEWEPSLVIYTNQMNEDRNSYEGTYLYTTGGQRPSRRCSPRQATR